MESHGIQIVITKGPDGFLVINLPDYRFLYLDQLIECKVSGRNLLKLIGELCSLIEGRKLFLHAPGVTGVVYAPSPLFFKVEDFIE